MVVVAPRPERRRAAMSLPSEDLLPMDLTVPMHCMLGAALAAGDQAVMAHPATEAVALAQATMEEEAQVPAAVAVAAV